MKERREEGRLGRRERRRGRGKGKKFVASLEMDPGKRTDPLLSAKNT
jgi:hypothetical protein